MEGNEASDVLNDIDYDEMNNQRGNVFVSYPDGNISISQDLSGFNFGGQNGFQNDSINLYNANGFASTLSFGGEDAGEQQTGFSGQSGENVIYSSHQIKQDNNNAISYPNQQSLQNKQLQQISQEFQRRLINLHRERTNRDIRRPPRVGRKNLDLYALFLAVQARGGYEHILQWKELGADLQLPPSVTNAGFVLRGKYDSLIRPFEAELLRDFWPPGCCTEAPKAALVGPVAAIQDQQKHVIQTSNNSNTNNLQYQVGTSGANCSSTASYGQDRGLPAPQVAQQSQQQQQPSQTTHIVPASRQNYICLFHEPGGNGFGQNYTLNTQNTTRPQQGVSASTQLKQSEARGASLKDIVLPNLDVDDDLFNTLISSNPGLESLTIGSLRHISRIPTEFPSNLRSLALLEVPRHLIPDVLRTVAGLRLRSLKITQWAGGPATPVNWGHNGANTAQDSLD